MPANIHALDPDALNQLTVTDPDSWSAGKLHRPPGWKLIVLNPTHNPNRQRASLMEETSAPVAEPSALASIIARWRDCQNMEQDTRNSGVLGWSRSIAAPESDEGCAYSWPRRCRNGRRAHGKRGTCSFPREDSWDTTSHCRILSARHFFQPYSL